MDPRSSNSFQLDNEPTWELLGTNQNQNLSDAHSSQGLETTQVENPAPLSISNDSDEILRYIDQILKEDDLEHHIMHQESSDFRAKERSLFEAIGQKYPPPQQESPSLINGAQYVDDDDSANNTDEVIIEKTSHSDQLVDNVHTFLIQEFDDSLWMYTVDEKLTAEMANMVIMGKKMMQPAGGAKIHTKKRNNRREKDDEVVSMKALLIDCSKSVSTGDRVAANDLLRKIRQHSSPYGDGVQRLAHYFADGLDARLAGIMHNNTDSSDYLRAHHMSCSPSIGRKIFSFASNEMIVNKSEKATIIHVIDFGILYGIQWPSFIRRVAGREGGPPKKLRITGIDIPRVAEIIEDTGSRLARYAEALGVPFEYKAISRKWETIKIDDLKIEKDDEFVAVVCSIRSVRLLDETVGMAESPRSMFLKLAREINPNIFVHTIINASFNQPFFTYRFRDLLLFFWSVFDIMETLVPRDQPERVMIERDLFGNDILNVIACEGPERVFRPETFRQWQVRNLKAGFVKVPFERKLIDAIACKVSNNFYHKDYLIFEENQWMMMSWKGRAMCGISCWQPAAASGI